MPTTAATTPSKNAPQDVIVDDLRAALFPDEIIAALLSVGLDAKDLAAGTGADERTVRRWLEDKNPNRTYEQSLGTLRVVVLYILQRRGLPRERVAQWLRMPNVELGFQSPLEALAEGRRGDVVVAADAAIAPLPRRPLPATGATSREETITAAHAGHDYQPAGV